MAGNITFCSICEKRNHLKPTTDWCAECEQAFCFECNEFHSLAKSSTNHVTISIEEYLCMAPSIMAISAYCIEHNDKYQMFCQTHEAPICPSCIYEHTTCDKIPLNKMTKNVKSSISFKETEGNLKDIDENVSAVYRILQERLTDLGKQKEYIILEINQLRKKINSHLDKIEKKARNEIMKEEDKSIKDIQTKLKILEEKKCLNAKALKQLEDMIKYASDLQTYFGLKKLSSEATNMESFIKSANKNESWKQITLSFSADKKLSTILKEITEFGMVQIQNVPCDFAPVKHKEKESRQNEETTSSRSIIDLNLELVRVIKTNGIRIRGCSILPDGGKVFSDYHSSKDCVIAIDADDKQLFEISLRPRYAFDLTCIDEKIVAVTSGKYHFRYINIVDLDIKKVIKDIYVDYPCHGITFNDGVLIYCAEGIGIQKKNISSGKTETIVQFASPSLKYVAAHNEKIFFTDYETKTLTCSDMTGNIIWRFKDESVLMEPQGITVDGSGHIYVVDCKKSCVVVFSPDGKHKRQLLSEKDGLNSPFVLHYNKNTNHLLVANSEESAFLFHVS